MTASHLGPGLFTCMLWDRFWKIKERSDAKILGIHYWTIKCALPVVSDQKTKIQQTKETIKQNIPVFSFISHKTLKRAGFILWQFSACFLKGGQDTTFQINIQTSGNSNKRVGHSHIPAVSSVRSGVIYKTCRRKDTAKKNVNNI